MDSSVIATQPDVYAPMINNEGLYVDKVPPQHVFSVSGIRCPCSIRKDTVFWTRQGFTSHTKTKTHQNWLSELSLENENLYVKNQEMEKIIKEQKIIIARLERELSHRDITIMTLTRQFSTHITQTQLENTTTSSQPEIYYDNIA